MIYGGVNQIVGQQEDFFDLRVIFSFNPEEEQGLRVFRGSIYRMEECGNKKSLSPLPRDKKVRELDLFCYCPVSGLFFIDVSARRHIEDVTMAAIEMAYKRAVERRDMEDLEL